VVSDPADLREIARLAARVAELERLLSERSREARALAREVCDEDLVVLSRIAAGHKPLASPRRSAGRWVETTVLTTADVETTMKELWRSTVERGEDPGE
jgi:hypothetical protein